MARKRKADDIPGRLPKRVCDSPDEDYDDASLSSDSADYKVNYTDNGTRRADSEARRQWHYVCTVDGCGQRFNRPCRLDIHMRSHNKERPFACPHNACDKTFPRKDHLQRHLKNAHAGADAREHICDWPGCNKSFTSSGRLQRHQDVHASKHYCTGFPPCNEAFRKEKALEAHIKSQHLEVKPYPCTHVDPNTGDRCKSGYQTESALQRHMARIHGPEQEDGLFCMLCTAPDADKDSTGLPQLLSFATTAEMRAHMRELHPPICPECGQQFKSETTLKSHCDSVHADPSSVPQFPCPNPTCDSVFNRKHNLTVHIRTVHEKQFKYTCTSSSQHTSKHPDLRNWDGNNACGASFKAKSSLDQHIRTHHLGLTNRKETRRLARTNKKKNQQYQEEDPPLLTLLTGVGYDANRHIPCLYQPTCEHRFSRDRDLRRHLVASHALSDAEAVDSMRERAALTGGAFWIGGVDPEGAARGTGGDEFSNDPSMPQTPAGGLDMHMHTDMDVGMEKVDPRLGFFDARFGGLALWDDVQLDAEMGIDCGMPVPVDRDGSEVGAGTATGTQQWGMLEPVERWNMLE